MSRKILGPSEADIARLPQYDWVQEGAFNDADGAAVRACDDVVLLDDIAMEDSESGPYRIPAGTVATVLFFQREAEGMADLECCWPEEGSFSFGFAPTRRLRLHMKNEEKYPR